MSESSAKGKLRIDSESAEFWDRASRGEFVFRWCTACERPFHYPRPFCPGCWSTELEWRAASGRGEIYSFTVIRQNGATPFNERLPYAVALVDLEEGIRILTNIDADVDTIWIGQPVEVAFRDEDGLSVPAFRPLAAP